MENLGSDREYNIEYLKGELGRVNQELHILTERRRNLEQNLAEWLCPYNVGDQVINKRNGKLLQVSRINSQTWSREGYTLLGIEFKKDGTLSKNTRELYPSDIQPYTAEKQEGKK